MAKPQIIPSRYYCKQSKGKVSTLTARPRFDKLYARALGYQTEDVWVNSFSSSEPKRKKVVVNLTKFIINNAFEHVYDVINSLLQAGFELYYYDETQEKMMAVIDPKQLFSMKQTSRKLPTPNLLKIVHEDLNHISADDVIEMDDSECIRFSQDVYSLQYKETQEMRLHEFSKIPIIPEMLDEFLEQNYDGSLLNIQIELSKDFDKLTDVKSLLAQLKQRNIPVQIHFQYMMFTEPEVRIPVITAAYESTGRKAYSDWVLNHLKQPQEEDARTLRMGYITALPTRMNDIYNDIILPASPEDLEGFCMEYIVPTNTSEIQLSNPSLNQYIKAIKLNTVRMKDITDIDSIERLDALTVLSTMHSDDDVILKIIEKAPNIQDISYENSSLECKIGDILRLSASSLRSLNLFEGNISSSDLSDIYLPQLTSIKMMLNSKDISGDQLNILLKAAPNLQKITTSIIDLNLLTIMLETIPSSSNLIIDNIISDPDMLNALYQKAKEYNINLTIVKIVINAPNALSNSLSPKNEGTLHAKEIEFVPNKKIDSSDTDVTYRTDEFLNIAKLTEAIAIGNINMIDDEEVEIPKFDYLTHLDIVLNDMTVKPLPKRIIMGIINNAANLKVLYLSSHCVDELLDTHDIQVILNLPDLEKIVIDAQLLTPNASKLLTQHNKRYKEFSIPKLGDYNKGQAVQPASVGPSKHYSYMSTNPFLWQRRITDPLLHKSDILNLVDSFFTLKPYFKRSPPAQKEISIRQELYTYNSIKRNFKLMSAENGMRFTPIFSIKSTANEPLRMTHPSLNRDDCAVINHHGGLSSGYQLRPGKRIPIYTELPQDELLQITITPEKYETIKGLTFQVERGEDDLFYISADNKKPIDINIDAVIATRKPNPSFKSATKKYDRNEKFQELIDYIKDFKVTESFKYYSLFKHTLDIAYEEKVGRCEIRCKVFADKFHQLQNEKKIPSDYEVRIVMGSKHAWLEWRPERNSNKPFEKLDELGGYPAILKYEAPPASTSVSLMTESSRPKKDRLAKEPKRDYTPPNKMGMPSLHEALKRNKGANILLTVNKPEDILPLTRSLYRAYPGCCHYVNNENHLLLSMPGEVREGDTWKTAPEIPTHFSHVLDSVGAHRPIIVLNLSPEDLVKYNSIMDSDLSNRTINGKTIPPKAVVITVVTKESPCLFDDSITSRQTLIAELASTNLALAPAAKQADEAHKARIFLNESPDWQAQLIGYCDKDQSGHNRICYGQLFQVLKQNPEAVEVEIINPPPGNEDFLIFIEQVNTSGGFYFLNQWYKIKFKLSNSTQSQLHFGDSPITINCAENVAVNDFDFTKTNHHFINNDTFERTIRNISAVNGTLISKPGWVEAVLPSDNKELSLYVSTELTVNQWSSLILACNNAGVKLCLYLAPSITIPNTIVQNSKITINKIDKVPSSQEKKKEEAKDRGGVYIQTNHPWQCAQKLEDIYITKSWSLYSSDKADDKHSESNKQYIRLDMTELSEQDSLYDFVITYENKQWNSALRQSDIVTVLENGGQVILEGKLNPQLFNYFSTLFTPNPFLYIEGKKVDIQGKLSFITDQAIPQSYWLPSERVEYRQIDLSKSEKAEQVTPVSLPILPMSKQDSPAEFWTDEEYQQVVSDRQERIIQHLSHETFAYLEGPAGGGKTSLMLRLDEAKATTYHENDIMKWLKESQSDKPNKLKILFIDEANLRGKDWTIFQSLDNRNPAILYQGKLYPLSKQHKVVFAGNPLDHGGDRNEPALFQRNPQNIIHCPHLALGYLEHAIVRKIFSSQFEAEAIEKRSQEFLRQPDIMSLDIRTLQSRAILYCSDCLNIAAGDEPGKHSVENYIDFESRKPCKQAILNCLKIRKFKRLESDEAHLNPAKAGGHSGVLIEAEPETGKTALIRATLAQNGYTEVTLDSLTPLDHNVYFVMHMANMEEILDRAFQEGAILLWDEINSYLTPELTEKLNAYLSGHDKNKAPPRKPGFSLISSINPAYMHGRKEIGTALRSRLTPAELPPYTEEELSMMLARKMSKGAMNLSIPLSLNTRMAIKDFKKETQKAKDDKRRKPGARSFQQKAEKFSKMKPTELVGLPPKGAEGLLTWKETGIQKPKQPEDNMPEQLQDDMPESLGKRKYSFWQSPKDEQATNPNQKTNDSKKDSTSPGNSRNK